jgi:hypothetical protein
VQNKNVSSKFCLSAVFAARDLATVTERGNNRTRTGIVPVQKDVKVDVVYFQGPSVKGVSGSPLISRDTGRVVGIVTLKLTGIGESLFETREKLRGSNVRFQMGGVNIGGTLEELIGVLDEQLANGLGAATGIDDPKHALARAERETTRGKPAQ